MFESSGNFLALKFFATTCPSGSRTNTDSGQCFDVSLDGGLLAPGSYQIALSTFENRSFAENEGAGTLAGGFTGRAADLATSPLSPTGSSNRPVDIQLTPGVGSVRRIERADKHPAIRHRWRCELDSVSRTVTLPAVASMGYFPTKCSTSRLFS